MGLHLRSEVYARVVRDPRLVEPTRQLLGDDALYVQQVKVNAKAAFSGDVWQWHYDFATPPRRGRGAGAPRPQPPHPPRRGERVQRPPSSSSAARTGAGPPRPRPSDTVTTSYPLWVVDDDTVAGLIEEGGLVSAKGPPGTMLIFGDTLVHSSSLNMSPWPRHDLLPHPEPGLERPHPPPAPGPPAPTGTSPPSRPLPAASGASPAPSRRAGSQ